MSKRNDFMTGFLQGLYQSGVGNPEVQRANEAATQASNATVAKNMADQGMVPNELPNDHPVRAKIGSFISSLFGGSSTPPLLASSFQVDPERPNYYQTPAGETSFTKGTTPIPPGAAKVPLDKGPGLASSTGKMDRTNIGFDSAKSMATLAGKPQALDTVILNAQKQGRDYITKDEMNNAMKAISTGSFSERADFYKQQADINRQRLELAKRTATYGGKMGQGQMALNTAIGHLGDAMDSMTNLGNTDVNALNTPINEMGQKMNNGDIVAAGINLTALENELAAAYKGGGATDQEIQQWRTHFNTSLTPQQWLDAATKTSQLLNSKIGAFGYQQGLINPDVKGKNPLSPEAQKTINKISLMKKSTPQINSQAEYDALPVGSSYIDSHGTKSVKR